MTAARLAAVMALALAPAAASAQPSPTVAARALLIEQAERAAAAGDHGAALALAERAGRIEMTPSLRMIVAEQQLATGASAAAMSSALLCGREAARDPALPYRDNVIARCRDVVQRARASAALVVVRAPADAVDPGVELDGRPLPAELLDVPQPVDPGPHTVVLRARSRLPSTRTFEARSGEAQDIALELGPPEPTPVAVTPPPAPVAPRPAPVPGRSGPAPGAVALVVAGGTAVAASAVFFALRAVSAEGCSPGSDPAGSSEQVWLCDTAAQVDAVGMRPTWTTLAGVSLGVGVASLGAGVAWWLLGRRAPAAPRPSVSALPGGAALSVVGTF